MRCNLGRRTSAETQPPTLCKTEARWATAVPGDDAWERQISKVWAGADLRCADKAALTLGVNAVWGVSWGASEVGISRAPE